MARKRSAAGMLADMVYDTCWGNPWHRLAEAAAGLSKDDLAYAPVASLRCDWGEDDDAFPRVLTPRHILYHVAYAAEAYGNGLAGRTDDPSEEEWEGLRPWRRSSNPARLVRVAEVACRRLHARAKAVEDGELLSPSGIWYEPLGAAKGFVLMDGAILHAAWHCGQLALLIGWRQASEKTEIARPPAAAGRPAPPYGTRDWADLRLGSRKEACLRLLRASHEESCFHALRRTLEGASPGELTWSAFPGRWGPLIAMHVAHCKAIYADQAFGEGTLTWGECDRLLGSTWRKPTARKALAVLDRAHEFLVERVAQATDDDLDRVNPMHHEVPMTGWQVVACMAQHDAWHAGQISIMRDVYAALTQEGRS